MTTMIDQAPDITIGVDTHRDNHVAALLDPAGRLLATGTFPASETGYRNLIDWAETFGPISDAGIEGTGSYGAGLTRFVRNHGVPCVEVCRPNRQHRRRHGKSDEADAVAAGRAVQSGEADGQPRQREGVCEALRVLRVPLRSATKARIQAINQLRALIVTAPHGIRSQLDGLSISRIVKTVSRFRIGSNASGVDACIKRAMRLLARRVVCFDNEIADLKRHRDRIVRKAAPVELLDEVGIGPGVASDLLIAIGENPDRFRSEAAFAALCGVSPVDASSGLRQRHRLNRGGDRQANRALWTAVLVRLSCHEETRLYMARTLARGKRKREVIRLLKRYLARRVWNLLQEYPLRFDNL